MRRDAARRTPLRRIAGLAVVGLMLPLAACATGEANGVGLVRAGCPTQIRIQTDDMPRVEWGFLYGLLDQDAIRIGVNSVRAPLLIDGHDSGAELKILLGDPNDGVHANVELNDDETVLLGAVDTDVAILDAARYPTVGVFAPLLRDTRIAYWDARTYPGVPTVQAMGRQATPDGSAAVTFATHPGDPFTDFAVGDRIVTVEQLATDPPPTMSEWLDAGSLSVQFGDVLTDPDRFEQLTEAPEFFVSQLLDDAGYERDRGVLSVQPKNVVRYADCLAVLVPVLQQALADYLNDPDDTTALVVALSAALGDDSYDADRAATALEALTEERLVGNGRDGTIGDIDLGRVRDLFDEAIPAWRRADVIIPAKVRPDDIVTNDFIDPTIAQ